jgi:hypothetical protein
LSFLVHLCWPRKICVFWGMLSMDYPSLFDYVFLLGFTPIIITYLTIFDYEIVGFHSQKSEPWCSNVYQRLQTLIFSHLLIIFVGLCGHPRYPNLEIFFVSRHKHNRFQPPCFPFQFFCNFGLSNPQWFTILSSIPMKDTLRESPKISQRDFPATFEYQSVYPL